MKKPYYGILIVFALILAFGSARADVQVGATVTDDGVKQFYLAIGKFYNVPERAVTVIKKKGLSDEELAVVFFLAERAAVKPAAIIELRHLGKSWMDITVHFGLSPEIYYVPVNGDPGPPYGKAYGYWKKHPRNEWRNIRLNDQEVCDLVNLRFVSKHYGIPADDVCKWRGDGDTFTKVNGKAKEHKEKQKQAAKAAKSGKGKQRADANDDDNGKSNGNGKKNK